MSITYTAPQKATIETLDDGYLVDASTTSLNFDQNASITTDGYGATTIVGSLETLSDGYYIEDALTLSFDSNFAVSTDGYGNVSVEKGAGFNVLSPGFTFGRSGKVNSGAYLLNDTVPSNLAGRIVPIVTGELSTVIVNNELVNTFDVTVQKKVGVNLVDIATVNVVNQKIKIETFNGVSLTYGDELAVKISNGSCKQPIIGIIIQAT